MLRYRTGNNDDPKLPGLFRSALMPSIPDHAPSLRGAESALEILNQYRKC